MLIYGAVFYEYSAKVNLSQGGLLMKRREFLSSFGGVLSVSALNPGFLSKAFAAGETTNLPFANGRRPLWLILENVPNSADSATASARNAF